MHDDYINVSWKQPSGKKKQFNSPLHQTQFGKLGVFASLKSSWFCQNLVETLRIVSLLKHYWALKTCNYSYHWLHSCIAGFSRLYSRSYAILWGSLLFTALTLPELHAGLPLHGSDIPATAVPSFQGKRGKLGHSLEEIGTAIREFSPDEK